MTEPFNTDLYDQRIDAMKCRERRVPMRYSVSPELVTFSNNARNTGRLAAYKRKRAEMNEITLDHLEYRAVGKFLVDISKGSDGKIYAVHDRSPFFCLSGKTVDDAISKASEAIIEHDT